MLSRFSGFVLYLENYMTRVTQHPKRYRESIVTSVAVKVSCAFCELYNFLFCTEMGEKRLTFFVQYIENRWKCLDPRNFKKKVIVLFEKNSEGDPWQNIIFSLFFFSLFGSTRQWFLLITHTNSVRPVVHTLELGTNRILSCFCF